MGCCCSVSCDQLLSDVVNKVTECLCLQASYIYNIEDNLKALEETMKQLQARRNGISRKVEGAENRGLRTIEEVELWLQKVETIESEVNKLLSDKKKELQRLCLCGFCSKNLKSSYSYGKLISAMLEEVEKEKANGVFEEVAEQVQASEVVERLIQPNIVGQETMLEKAWNRLIDDKVGMLGLYGMGGVGKTTLLEQINNKFKGNGFGVVIWAVVSKDLQIHEIQEAIAKKLGLDGAEWNKKNQDQKVCDIHRVLSIKKFVLMLDDIWEKVDLKKIGVPFPNIENGSKVVFTTRSLEVCGRMAVDFEMEVQCLSPEDALDLFRKTVGEITLGSHPDIPKLAEEVAKKCRGLPLALTIIGEAMSFKRTTQEWHNAIDVLTSNAAKFSAMEDEVLPILKYSYDNLKGDQVQPCLLYCALFPEDERISKSDLIEYWICEGIIDDNEGMEKAENQGYEIIGSLVRSSLLMEEHKSKVYMHDVVREMALWIASDFGKQKDHFVVRAGAGLSEVPKLKNWIVVKRLSLMANKIHHISGSPEFLQLTTLFLQGNKTTLNNISSEFLDSMPRLVVLDLSHNHALFHIPNRISLLVSLKYLNLSDTSIKYLPIGLQRLRNLLHLDLEYTSILSSIIGISALLKLKVLKLLYSKVSYSTKTHIEGVTYSTKEELEGLEQLEILTICIDSDSGLDGFLSSHKMMYCTQALQIQDCQLESSDIWRLASMEKVRELELSKCTISEIKMDTASITRETISPTQNPKNAFFLSLFKLHLNYCQWSKELSWLMFAPNLTELILKCTDKVEEIITKEKACEGEESGIVPFQKLEILVLSNLPDLKNIYWRPLPFPCLTQLKVRNCSNLRKLPLNSESGSSAGKGLIIEWEDKLPKTISYLQ